MFIGRLGFLFSTMYAGLTPLILQVHVFITIALAILFLEGRRFFSSSGRGWPKKYAGGRGLGVFRRTSSAFGAVYCRRRAGADDCVPFKHPAIGGRRPCLYHLCQRMGWLRHLELAIGTILHRTRHTIRASGRRCRSFFIHPRPLRAAPILEIPCRRSCRDWPSDQRLWSTASVVKPLFT